MKNNYFTKQKISEEETLFYIFINLIISDLIRDAGFSHQLLHQYVATSQMIGALENYILH